MDVNFSDLGAWLEGEYGVAETSALAGGAGDDTYTNGKILDLLSTIIKRATSMAVIVTYDATLAASETVDIYAKLEHGDQSNLSDAVTEPYDGAEQVKTAVQTGSVTNALGAVVFNFDLRGVKRYFRPVVKVDMSASGTDTCPFSAAVVLFSGEAPVADIS
jgi:hypothetical protein